MGLAPVALPGRLGQRSISFANKIYIFYNVYIKDSKILTNIKMFELNTCIVFGQNFKNTD